MRIGILGCGYVGQATAKHWRLKGHVVSVTTRRPEKVALLHTLANHVYLLGPQSLPEFMAQQEALVICVAPDSPSEYASTYLNTAQEVAKQLHQAHHLRHILYTSSTSVYGEHGGEWVDERTPLLLDQENAKILFETEKTLLQCASNEIKACIFRLGEIYGPGREIEHRLRRTHHQPFTGLGDSYTNLIHLTDIVQALDFALQQGLSGIYNLCNDFHVPRRLFYETLCKKEHIPSIKWDPTRSSIHQGNKRVSNQKLKEKGFIFSHPL